MLLLYSMVWYLNYKLRLGPNRYRCFNALYATGSTRSFSESLGGVVWIYSEFGGVTTIGLWHVFFIFCVWVLEDWGAVGALGGSCGEIWTH